MSGRESGRRTNFLSSSSLYSNLLHKSRDIGKRVSRFLCNEFAVRGEGKEGSKSRGEARLISPFTSGVFAETACRRRFPLALLVAQLFSSISIRSMSKFGRHRRHGFFILKQSGFFFHFHAELEIGALLRRHLFISRLASRPRMRYTGNQGKSGQGSRLSKRCDACEKFKRICYGIRGEGGEISQIPAVLLAPIKSSRVTWRFQNEAVGCQNTARRK